MAKPCGRRNTEHRVTFQLTRERYQGYRLVAAAKSLAATRARFGVDYDLQPWGLRAERAIADQWEASGRQTHWDWPGIAREHDDPSSWCLAAWSPGERLSVLAAARVTKAALLFTFLEGDPRPDCPLRKMRCALVLDAYVRYARLCGKKEIRADPLNDSLAKHYVERFGFEPVDGLRTLRLSCHAPDPTS